MSLTATRHGSDPTAEPDLLVVGYGIAGTAAAIEAADRGLSVLALDRGYGGGASALSGGVVYAGGGTRQQQAAGQEDSPQNMYDYLSQETDGIVAEATLRRFCEQSPAMIEWLEANGARFASSLCPYKTSYPTDAHYLYYSGNEKAWPFREHAVPAARGHRMVAEGLASGRDLLAAMQASAERKGVRLQPLSRVEGLVMEEGAVHGVRHRVFSGDADVLARHRRLTALAGKLGNWAPPLGAVLAARADALWKRHSELRVTRAGAVLLSAGGFVFNPAMRERYAGGFKDILPLGTAGDDGTGIRLGTDAGATADHMTHMTAWRFIAPPSALVKGVAVGPSGTRITNEDLYGATFSQVMIDHHGSRGWLICDRRIWSQARRQVRSQSQTFQFLQSMYLFTRGHHRAATLTELAKKLGLPAETMAATIEAYNTGVQSGDGDPAHKDPTQCAPVSEPPFYAIDISIKNSAMYPVPGLTLGGLRVDERSGAVLDRDDQPIPRLYAAGRNAVGICSNGYISGLSLADGVFSGRRAAAWVAGLTST